MNILVVSEGKDELGTDVDSSALVALVRRKLGDGPRFSLEPVSNQKFRIHKPRGKAAAYEKRALACLRFAEREGFDALILVIDEDGQKERRTGIENAQKHAKYQLPRAMGIAIRTFDTWMLADEVALSTVLNTNVQRQKQPETIKNPKKQCQTILSDTGPDFGLSEFYRRLVAKIDLDKLSDRCREGFAPFRGRVEALSEHQVSE
jgi:hypothetical protein